MLGIQHGVLEAFSCIHYLDYIYHSFHQPNMSSFLLLVLYMNSIFFWNGNYSQGAYSLLNHSKQASGSDASIGTMSIPSAELCEGHSYKITTYGITSSNEWHASLISPNSMGGTNYTLV